MLNETVIYLVDPCERPPYGRIAEVLWDQARMLTQTATVALQTTCYGRSYP